MFVGVDKKVSVESEWRRRTPFQELHPFPHPSFLPAVFPIAPSPFCINMTYEEPERELSEYEKKRLERIRKNEEHLKRLGLDKFTQNFKDTMRKRKSSSGSKNSSKKSKVNKTSRPLVPSRKSSRLVTSASGGSNKDTLVMLDYNQSDGVERVRAQEADEVDSVEEEIVEYTTYRARRRARRYNIDAENWELTDDEKTVLEKGITDNYLSKFQEFLKYHNMISEQNLRSVMRQVGKLARGDGIRYESPRYGWPENCYFKKGEKIGPLSDIVQLMEEAQECEDKWGRDHGNGWLLSHPLKKLLLFQQFALKNPSFLNAKCKLKEWEKSYDTDKEHVENETEAEIDVQDQMKMVSTPLPEEDKKSLDTDKEDVECENESELVTSPLPKEDATSFDTDNDEHVENETAKQDQTVSTPLSNNGKSLSAPNNGNSLSTDMIRNLNKKDSKSLIGVKVAKKFGKKMYLGTIDKYDRKNLFWHVTYDDGDEEEIDRGDLCNARYFKNKIYI